MAPDRRGGGHLYLAGWAMALAALGIGVSVLGARAASPWWEHRGGPALTLMGAVLWGISRWRAKGKG